MKKLRYQIKRYYLGEKSGWGYLVTGGLKGVYATRASFNTLEQAQKFKAELVLQEIVNEKTK